MSMSTGIPQISSEKLSVKWAWNCSTGFAPSTVMWQVMSRVKAARSADDTVDLVLGLSYTPCMSVTINVHAAKTQFSKLLARVIAGEEIIIAKAGKPVARLAPIGRQTAKKRVPGIDKGKIWMSKDFDVMTARELEDWYQTDNRLK